MTSVFLTGTGAFFAARIISWHEQKNKPSLWDTSSTQLTPFAWVHGMDMHGSLLGKLRKFNWSIAEHFTRSARRSMRSSARHSTRSTARPFTRSSAERNMSRWEGISWAIYKQAWLSALKLVFRCQKKSVLHYPEWVRYWTRSAIYRTNNKIQTYYLNCQ